MTEPRTAVLIVAAGRGARIGGDLPKQYLPLRGVAVLRRTVERFLSVDAVERIRIAIHPDDHALYSDSLSGVDSPRLDAPVTGGATRAASVRAGLEALAEDPPGKVLIHDAARPFVSPDAIRAVIAALDDTDGAALALPVVDALWRSDAGLATDQVSRDGLWRAQTPQGFRFGPILAAHRANSGDAADDIAVARQAGLAVRLIEGSEANYKITTTADLARAERDISTK